MASRRMFSKDVVCSDRFLDMPASAQALYFQYGLEADDDGFVSAPKKILRLTNASDDDLKILVAKGFLIPFDSGVVVIRDWKINNYLRRDRYTPTRFKEEFEQLDTIDDRYQLHVLAVGIPDDNHVVDMRDTQVRLGKDSIGKGSINNNVGRKMSHFTPPTVEEVQEYCFERGNAVDAQSFVDFYTSKGWYVGKTKMKDWKASVRTWEKNQRQKNKNQKMMRDWRVGSMLREETAKLLMMIQGAYPNYKPDNKTVTINTWNLALSDISFDLAQKAFLAYLRADTKGFAPTPGQLIALVRELNTPKQLNELEAWSLVEKAIRNSIYNSQEEFSKLPPLVQKAVGSPNVLRLWAADGSYSEQVASSNFMRSYRNEAKKQEEYEKLPADMQQMIDQTNRNSYSAQIREKNRDAIQIMTTTENAEIEAKDEPTGISQQSDERLKKLIEDFRQI